MLSGLETLLGIVLTSLSSSFFIWKMGAVVASSPSPIAALVRLAAGRTMTWVGAQGSLQTRKGSMMVETQAGRRRRPPRPPPPWAPDGECVGACKLKPHRLQTVGGHRLLSACRSPIQALVFSVQGAVAEGRGRGATGAGSHSSRLPLSLALDCPWTKA